MRRSFRFFLLLPVVATLLVVGCDNGTTNEPTATDISAVLSADGDYTSFVQALTATGLDATLRTGGPFTVFAPTDLAFEFLGMDTVERLLDPQNSDLLERVLRYHIVPGLLSVADLESGAQLQTLEGRSLVVEEVDGELRIGDAAISEANLQADNGLIHGVSDVLRMNLNTAERLRITPILETFSDQAIATGVDDFLAEQGQVTVFAPINNAFLDLGTPEFDLLTRASNIDVLGRVVDFHVALGRFDIPTIEPGAQITTRDGAHLTLTVEGSARYLNGRLIISDPVETTNGLIYLLDGVQRDGLNINERLRISPRLTRFTDAVADRPDLVSALTSSSDHTVFAPLNVAFEAFPPDVREAIFSAEYVDLLDQLTRVHIVPGRYASADLTPGLSLVTLDGTELAVQVDGSRIFVGGRLLSDIDIPVENGALHRVALTIKPHVSLMNRLLLEGFTDQIDAIQRAGLDQFFQGEGPFTMFAFPNELYSANPTILGRPDLDQIILYHAADGLIPLEHGWLFESLEGTNRTIAFEPVSQTYFLDGVGALLDYGSVRNGQLHSVDAFTEPPGSGLARRIQ